jgi:hypothetical protein
MIIHNPKISGSIQFPADADGNSVTLQVNSGVLETIQVDSSNNVTAVKPESNLSGSFTGSFLGDGSGLTGVSAINIDALDALGGASVAQVDNLVISDAGTEKKVTFSNLEDSVFGNVSGDVTIAAGGASTLASIANSKLANSSITIDGSAISLGGSVTTTNTQLSTEAVQDIAGALVATGGTKTGIAVTYDDDNNNMDFVVSLVKGDVGLGNVDNTADSAKPVSTAQQTEIDTKSDIASPTFTGTVGGITKGMVGLGNVDNTTDALKPVSTAGQTALDLKANLASPTLTGNPVAPTQADNDNSTKIATTAYVQREVSDLLGGAPAAYDTLLEISASISNGDSDVVALTTTVGTKLAKSTNLSDLADAGTARTNLGVDAAGTDNSTNVTLVTDSHDYLSVSGQAITLGSITNDDLAGSITNAKLSNSSISIDGSAISLGGSVTTLQLGTSSSTALAGNTTTISGGQASAITANTAKNTNVSTNLTITGTDGARTIVSSDGTNAIIPIATTSVSGVMSKAIFDEHVLNNAKATDVNHNVSTNLTATTAIGQITINSSDGDNVVIGEATDTIAGLMSTTHHDKLDSVETNADVTDTANVKSSLNASLGGSANIGDGSDTITIPGDLVVTGTTTTENVTTLTTSNGIVFEGSVADEHEATLLAGTLSADRTLTLPNATGTIALTSDLATVGAGGLTQQNFTTTLKNKLDGIEGSATADQTAAQIRTLVGTGNSNFVPSAGTSGHFLKHDGTFGLPSYTTNTNTTTTSDVTSAGALMDSEVTNLADVKSFDTSDYATSAQGTKADAALPKGGGAMTGAITTNSTFDGRDVATDGTKLDGIESNATADQTAAQIRTLVGTGNSNFVPSAGTAGHFLKHDGTFGIPSYTTNTDTNTQLSQEQVEDFVGGMLDGTETGITVGYDDTNGNLDFVVASQTENDFTTVLKNKLDGIEASADVNVVDSVAGKTGTVTLVKGDVGLGNLDNTTDALKPVSTAGQTALDLKANLASPTFTGTVSAPTPADNNDSTQIATTAFVMREVSDLIGGAPGTLDTLNELAAAINDDDDYSSTLTTALATKAPKASPTFTGTIAIPNIANLETAVAANTAKATDVNHNVTTNLTITGTTGARTIVSSDGTDAIIPIATTAVSGVMSKAIFDEHVLNNAKSTDVNHNVSTNLSKTVTTSNVTINSSDGDNIAIGAATTSAAGVMTKAIFDAVVLNTAKATDVNHNVTTNLSITGTDGARTIVSSDGTNAIIPIATTSVSGVMSKAIFDEHVANNAKNTNVVQTTITGNAGSVTNGVYTTGTQTISGAKTFSNTTASTTKTTGAVIVTGGVGISGALNVGGDVVAFASSDERLKDNIELISNPIEKVQSLKGVTWDWNSNADELQQSLPNVGVIAQDVEKVLPQLVTDRDNGFKGVDYAKLTGLLIEAVKDQQKQIDELKSKLS